MVSSILSAALLLNGVAAFPHIAQMVKERELAEREYSYLQSREKTLINLQESLLLSLSQSFLVFPCTHRTASSMLRHNALTSQETMSSEPLGPTTSVDLALDSTPLQTTVTFPALES